MRAFEVHLNGERLCVAGFDGDGVLNTMIDQVAGSGRRDICFRVGGLITATDEHVRWINLRLKVGDEVALKVVETESVDMPAQRFRTGTEQE